MAVLLRALRALFPLLRLRAWVLSAMIILGVLTALSEGLSISLFTLLQSQLGTGAGGIIGSMTAFFNGIPADRRLLWVGVSLLLAVMLKNALSYGYSVLSQWISASISHRLRCEILRQLLNVGQSYLDTHDSGKLLNTLSSDTWRVTSAFQVFASVIINVCMTLILSMMLLLISWKLTLITCFLSHGGAIRSR
jgi:ATP-binding cassette, subfamily B, bacterial MsbA